MVVWLHSPDTGMVCASSFTLWAVSGSHTHCQARRPPSSLASWAMTPNQPTQVRDWVPQSETDQW